MIVPLHTTPEASVKEIDELVDVYKYLKRHWKAEVMTLRVCWLPHWQGRNLVPEREG